MVSSRSHSAAPYQAATHNGPRKRLAIVATVWRYLSHAQHMGDRFLVGYPWEGQWHRPAIDVVALYVDQKPKDDQSASRAREFGFKVYPTIAEALRCGGRGLRLPRRQRQESPLRAAVTRAQDIADDVRQGRSLAGTTLSHLDLRGLPLAGATLAKAMSAHVDAANTDLQTDSAKAYQTVSGQFRSHQTVDHSAGEYVRGDVHTNSIESAWSLFDRAVIGSYHQLSAKHLDAYLAEFEWRFNNRSNPFLFRDTVLRLLAADTLRYKDLIA